MVRSYAPPLEQIDSSSNLMATFTNEIMMLEDVHWAGLDDCFDGDLSNHATVNETQIVEAHRDGAYVNNLGLNEIFVGHMSRSCSEASSHSSSYETPLSTIYPSPTRAMENLLSTHTPPPFSMAYAPVNLLRPHPKYHKPLPHSIQSSRYQLRAPERVPRTFSPTRKFLVAHYNARSS